MASRFTSSYHGMYGDLHTPAVIAGGVFVLIAVALSCFLILQHLRSYTNPKEQTWIIGVLFMVPFYACESIISLWNPRFSVVCDILRNCYEAFALYCFGCYLVACLGGERRVLDLFENGARQPFCESLIEDNKVPSTAIYFRDFFCHPNMVGEDLYAIVKFGIVQYMILKTLCAFLALILELFGMYGDGEFKWYYGYPYIAVVLNFSQMWALLCLVQFYNVTHERLRDIKPLAKFISFKAIVFATWWQGVGIAIVCYFGFIPKKGKIQNGIQDFLICIEMAIAAVVHIFVFPAKPYQFIPIPENAKMITEETRIRVELEGSSNGKPVIVEEETHIKAPGTSISESVQDVVLSGGEHVVKDVMLTITQAVEPVEKGVNKIQETIHHISRGGDSKEEEAEEVVSEFEAEEHDKESITDCGTRVVSSEMTIKTRDSS